jgi:hypothetical protein
MFSALRSLMPNYCTKPINCVTPKEDPGCLLATACITLYGTLLSVTFVSMLAEKGDIVTKAEGFFSVAFNVGCLIFVLALILYSSHWLLNQVLSDILPSRKKDKILSEFERMRIRLDRQGESPGDTNIITPTDDQTP